jgi:hypothetical protein
LGFIYSILKFSLLFWCLALLQLIHRHSFFFRYRHNIYAKPYRDMHVLVFMFDIHVRETFCNIKKWMKEAERCVRLCSNFNLSICLSLFRSFLLQLI